MRHLVREDDKNVALDALRTRSRVEQQAGFEKVMPPQFSIAPFEPPGRAIRSSLGSG
jgi:hypothetical protein